jgi:hypothetical protein
MYARGAYAPRAERERIMDLVRDARRDSTVTAPPENRIRARRPAGRLMRGGLAQARSTRTADEIVDDGAPIQQSLF